MSGRICHILMGVFQSFQLELTDSPSYVVESCFVQSIHDRGSRSAQRAVIKFHRAEGKQQRKCKLSMRFICFEKTLCHTGSKNVELLKTLFMGKFQKSLIKLRCLPMWLAMSFAPSNITKESEFHLWKGSEEWICKQFISPIKRTHLLSACWDLCIKINYNYVRCHVTC